MFTKLLIFAIFGATLVLASPVDNSVTIGNDEVALRAAWTENLKKWWNEAKEKVNAVFLKLRDAAEKTAKKVFEELKGSGLNFLQVAKERYEKVKAAFVDIKQDAEIAFEEEKKIWQGKLQDAIKYGKEVFDKLKVEALQAIKETKGRWEGKVKEYGNQLQDALERIQQRRLE